MATITFQPSMSQISAPPNTVPGKLRARLMNSGGLPVGGPFYQDPPQFGTPFVFLSVSTGNYNVELMRFDEGGSLLGTPFLSPNINVPAPPPPVLVDVPTGGAATVS